MPQADVSTIASGLSRTLSRWQTRPHARSPDRRTSGRHLAHARVRERLRRVDPRYGDVQRGRRLSGAVCVFDLVGHPTAKRAYAWSHEAGEGGKRRFVVVLHAGPVDSPVAAVRAPIVAEHRGRS